MSDKKIINFSNAFDSTIRIQMLSSLLTTPLTFKQLKIVCQCTDGTLKHHAEKLVEVGFVTVEKKEKPKNIKSEQMKKAFYHNHVTVYKITELGKEEYIAFTYRLMEDLNKEQERERSLNYEKNNIIFD